MRAVASGKTALSRETIGLLVGRANRYLQQHVAALCTPEGITSQQLWIVLMLREGDVITASDLAARMPIDKATASRLVERLVELGWVATGASAVDRRRQLLSLTASGKRAAVRLGRRAEAVYRRMVAGLSAEELAALSDGLKRVIANLS
jgi:DNA-binding MarR family transcriptional regulator